MNPSRSSLLALSSLLLTSSLQAQGLVHVVDDDGAGAHFQSVAAAVAAAADGDLILVRDGNYIGTEIAGKSLTVVAEAGDFVQLQYLWVRDLDPQQTVTLQGLTIRSNFPFTAENNQGAVLVDDCALWAISTFPGFETRGAQVIDSASVTFSGCQLLSGSSTPGSHGIEARDSNVTLYGCDVNAAGAASVYGVPQIAGAGVDLAGGSLVAVGSIVRGGEGAMSWAFPGMPCVMGGDGGHGIHARAGILLPTSVTLLDTVAVGGPGGPASVPPCVNGMPGQDLEIEVGPLNQLSALSSDLTVKSPVRAGQNTQFTFTAQIGDRAATVESPGLQPKWFGQLSGTLVPARLGAKRRFGGFLTASTLTVSRATSIASGEEFDVTYVQSLIRTAGKGTVLGPPRALIVLDPNL